MRNFLLAAVLSAGALALAAGQTSAGMFGSHHCCDKCCTFCVKQYNAFSPVCFGSLCFDGCGPCCGQSAGGACGGQPGCGQPAGPSFSPSFDSGCPDGSCQGGFPQDLGYG